MDPESGYGVVKNPKNGVILVARDGTSWRVKVAGQLGPMSTANGAGDATMSNIGRDAGKMECMRALSSEYSLPRAAP